MFGAGATFLPSPHGVVNSGSSWDWVIALIALVAAVTMFVVVYARSRPMRGSASIESPGIARDLPRAA
jgi:hypothetical protein